MRHINAVTLFTQIFVQFIGNKNAAVLSACAAYADNKLCLAFVNILRYKKIKQLLLQLQILEGRCQSYCAAPPHKTDSAKNVHQAPNHCQAADHA